MLTLISRRFRRKLLVVPISSRLFSFRTMIVFAFLALVVEHRRPCCWSNVRITDMHVIENCGPKCAPWTCARITVRVHVNCVLAHTCINVAFQTKWACVCVSARCVSVHESIGLILVYEKLNFLPILPLTSFCVCYGVWSNKKTLFLGNFIFPKNEGKKNQPLLHIGFGWDSHVSSACTWIEFSRLLVGCPVLPDLVDTVPFVEAVALDL